MSRTPRSGGSMSPEERLAHLIPLERIPVVSSEEMGRADDREATREEYSALFDLFSKFQKVRAMLEIEQAKRYLMGMQSDYMLDDFAVRIYAPHTYDWSSRIKIIERLKEILTQRERMPLYAIEGNRMKKRNLGLLESYFADAQTLLDRVESQP